MTTTTLAKRFWRLLPNSKLSAAEGLILRMARMRKPKPRSFQSRCDSKVQSERKLILDDFRGRRAKDALDSRYLEVVEEMLTERENNGRDRDESPENESRRLEAK